MFQIYFIAGEMDGVNKDQNGETESWGKQRTASTQ